MYILYSPVTGGPVAGIFGFIVQGELKSNWNIDVPWLWWVTVLVFAPLTAYLQWRGIKLSTRVHADHRRPRDDHRDGPGDLTGFIDPPSGSGDQPQRLQPVVHPGRRGLRAGRRLHGPGPDRLGGLGAARRGNEEPEAERAAVGLPVDHPDRPVPGDRLLGRDHRLRQRRAARSPARPELPALALAHRVWGAGWIIILFAFLNSVARRQHRLRQRRHPDVVRHGPQRVVPEAARPRSTRSTRRRPTRSSSRWSLNIVAGLYVGFVFAAGHRVLPDDRPDPRPRRVRSPTSSPTSRSSGSTGRNTGTSSTGSYHVVFPIASTLVLLYAIYKSFPLSTPYDLAPWVDGLWFVVGIVLLVVLRLRGNEEWLTKAGESIAEA